MGRVSLNIRIEDDLISDVVNPLKSEGRLNRILIAALEGYRSNPAIRAFLEDGVAYSDQRIGEDVNAMLDSAIDSLDDSILSSERTQAVLEGGAEDFASGAPSAGTVNGGELAQLIQMVGEMYPIVMGASFTPSAMPEQQEAPINDSDAFSTEPIFATAPMPEFDEEPVTEEVPEIVPEVKAPRPRLVADDDEDDMRIVSTEAPTSGSMDAPKPSGKDLMAKLSKSTNMGGL